jgi:hypothetical protein
MREEDSGSVGESYYHAPQNYLTLMGWTQSTYRRKRLEFVCVRAMIKVSDLVLGYS